MDVVTSGASTSPSGAASPSVAASVAEAGGWRLELGREERATDPDDDTIERTSQESEGARFLVSKRTGALVKTGAWHRTLSF